MENIISYLAGDFISDLEKVRADIYKDPTAMAVFVKNTRKATDELARRFIEETVNLKSRHFIPRFDHVGASTPMSL